MKQTLIALCLLTSLGCARAYIARWHEQDFVVCGNQWCDKDCYTKEILNACQAGWQLKGQFVDSSVSGATTNGSQTTLNYSNRSCSQVHCMGPLFRAPATASE